MGDNFPNKLAPERCRSGLCNIAAGHWHSDSVFQERKDTMISSMKVDLDRGNPLEVGVLNGAVSKIGKKVRVSTPVNDFITSCLNIHHRRAISNQGMK